MYQGFSNLITKATKKPPLWRSIGHSFDPSSKWRSSDQHCNSEFTLVGRKIQYIIRYHNNMVFNGKTPEKLRKNSAKSIQVLQPFVSRCVFSARNMLSFQALGDCKQYTLVLCSVGNTFLQSIYVHHLTKTTLHTLLVR